MFFECSILYKVYSCTLEKHVAEWGLCSIELTYLGASFTS